MDNDVVLCRLSLLLHILKLVFAYSETTLICLNFFYFLNNFNMDTSKIEKIWKVVKTIVEIIIAALAGAVTATTAHAAGLLSLLH